IDVNKIYYVGTTRVESDSALRSALIPMIQRDAQDPTVVINADKTVPIDYVVAVMRVAREMGAKAVLAVDKRTQ
ncbi:MAG TPA: biopolymer transporter ExbD, partial [Flavisolibacter sp.]|nr:biopolymer transporter ExbD [Flavisolibacter sp.]